MEQTPVLNPFTWAFRKYLYGHPINPMQFAKKARSFYQNQQDDLIGQMCKVTGMIAIASAVMTKRQRLKYSANRITTGRNVFYLFTANRIPADVGSRVRPVNGVYVYRDLDDDDGR